MVEGGDRKMTGVVVTSASASAASAVTVEALAGSDGLAWLDERDARAATLHGRFMTRRRQRAAWDAEEARDLRAAEAMQLWNEYGCVTLFEYLEVHCGMDGRGALERVRVALALGDLPLLEAELEAGTFGHSHVRELTRIVVPDTEEEWVAYARGKTFREIQRAVAGRSRGDRPSDPTQPDRRKRALGWELEPATIARLHAAMAELEAQRGERFVDDDDRVNALCDVLEASASGESSALGLSDVNRGAKQPAQVWLTNSGQVFAHGVELPEESAAHLLCDADVMGHVDDEHARVVHTITPRKRKRILARDGNRCRVPGCRHQRNLEVHHIVPRELDGDDSDGNLLSLCSGHHRLHHQGLLVIRLVGDAVEFERPGCDAAARACSERAVSRPRSTDVD